MMAQHEAALRPAFALRAAGVAPVVSLTASARLHLRSIPIRV